MNPFVTKGYVSAKYFCARLTRQHIMKTNSSCKRNILSYTLAPLDLQIHRSKK